MISATPGILVSVEARSYNSFTNSQTGQTIPAGVTHHLYLAPSFEGPVLTVRCDQATYDQAKAMGQGCNVECLVEIGAKGNRVTYSCRGLALVSKNGAKVPA